MRVAGGKKTSVWEWAALIGTVAAVVAASAIMNLSPKWEHAFVYTVIVFMTVMVVLRPAWSRPAFWRGLLLLLMLHILIVVSITQSLSPENPGIHGVPLIAACMAEGLLIISVLWRVSQKENRRTNGAAGPGKRAE